MAGRRWLVSRCSLGVRRIHLDSKDYSHAITRLCSAQTPELPCFSPKRDQQRRSFGYGTNWKIAPKNKKKRRTASQGPKERPSASFKPLAGDRSVSPPALLVPTASPHVFASLYAAQQHQLPRSPPDLFPPELLNNLQRPKCRYHGPTPPPDNSGESFAEVAVLGRSNVGKSSLLNALTGQSLQRVSKQPGRTQHPHFLECCAYHHNGSSGGSTAAVIGYLMDLPGYGFAVGPDKAVDAWQRRTQGVLLQRRDCDALKRVYLLVDGRHGATSLDLSIMGWLEEGEFPFTVVLTKCDAVSLPLIVKHVNQVCMRYHHEATAFGNAEAVIMSPLVHVTSSKNGTGLLELWASILDELQCN